jgi:hypothetical protein
MPGGGEVSEHGFDLALAQGLRLFSECHQVLLTRYLWAAGRWTIISQDRQYMPTGKYLSACQGLGGTDDLMVIL